MTLGDWVKMLARERFAIHPLRWPMTACVTTVTAFNSVYALLQQAFYRRQIAQTDIVDDPIFIVGHWRAGTTLLHELLVTDERYTYPTTYQCFTPKHFLVSGKFLPALIRGLLPKKRPMDNMPAGWDHPQEDEFALANMGLPTPYLMLAFPNRIPYFPEYLDMKGVPPKDVARWKDGFLRFLKSVTLRTPKRIVLKSPPHTARIKTLLEMFPKARFVHIVRDPYTLFSSTVNLWKRLAEHEGLQMVQGDRLDEYVYHTMVQMYDAFHEQQPLIDPSRFCEVRYEDLVKNPLGEMRRVYDELALGGFDKAHPAMQAYMAGQSNYKANRWQIPAETRAEIARRWRFYFERYGYPIDRS